MRNHHNSHIRNVSHSQSFFSHQVHKKQEEIKDYELERYNQAYQASLAKSNILV